MPPTSMTTWHLRGIDSTKVQQYSSSWARSSQISTTWSHNCCGFRGGLFPYLKILPSFNLAHKCSITFIQVTWEAKVLVRSWASSQTIFEHPCCRARGGYPARKLNFLWDFKLRFKDSTTFSKICTYCGALNRPRMRSSMPMPSWDIQP